MNDVAGWNDERNVGEKMENIGVRACISSSLLSFPFFKYISTLRSICVIAFVL